VLSVLLSIDRTGIVDTKASFGCRAEVAYDWIFFGEGVRYSGFQLLRLNTYNNSGAITDYKICRNMFKIL
jgi:hypothetical protein